MRILPTPPPSDASPGGPHSSWTPLDEMRLEAVEKAMASFQGEVQTLQRTIEEMTPNAIDIPRLRETLDQLDRRLKDLESHAAAPPPTSSPEAVEVPIQESSLKEVIKPASRPESAPKNLMTKMWKYLNEQKAA
jgi:hypothetical protein